MSNQLVKQILRSDSYWVLNKTIVKIYGVEGALMLSVLAEAEFMMADDDGYFYQTSESIKKLTGLTRHKQDRVIDELEKSGVLLKKVKGLPAKRYFKLDCKKIENKIVENQQTSLSKTDNNKESTYKESTYKESTNTRARANKSTLESFEKFWEAYPKKIAKKAVLQKWKKLKVNDALFESIMKGLEAWKQSQQWMKDGGQYIPNPTTFLNQERWNDETPEGVGNVGKSTAEDFEDKYKQLYANR